MGQEGKSVGGMSSSCLGELSLHLFKGEEGNKNCILGQPQSWRTELGSNPVSFLPDRCNWGNMSFQNFLHWLEEGHETLLPSQGPLSFLGLCLSQHLLLVLQSFKNPAPQLSPAPSAGDSLLSQQTGRRQRITVEQHCLGVQGLSLGSSFAPTPWNHAEGTRERAWKGCFVFSTPSPAPTTSLPPTAKAGKSPSGHGCWVPYSSGDSAPWWQLDTCLMNIVLFIRDQKGRARSKPTSALSVVLQTQCHS